MSNKKTRRHHTPDQKINLLRRHHLEKVSVSEVCEGGRTAAERVLWLAALPVRAWRGGLDDDVVMTC